MCPSYAHLHDGKPVLYIQCVFQIADLQILNFSREAWTGPLATACLRHASAASVYGKNPHLKRKPHPFTWAGYGPGECTEHFLVKEEICSICRLGLELNRTESCKFSGRIKTFVVLIMILFFSDEGNLS